MIGPVDCVEYVGTEQMLRSGSTRMKFKVVNSSDQFRCGLSFYTEDIDHPSVRTLLTLANTKDLYEAKRWLVCMHRLRCIWKRGASKHTGEEYIYPHFFLGEGPSARVAQPSSPA